jgi:hypothetical protein
MMREAARNFPVRRVVHRTKLIRLKRSVLIDGSRVEGDSIQEVAQPIADDLIYQGCAVQLNWLSQLFARIWFFFHSRIKRKERNEEPTALIERAEELGPRLDRPREEETMTEEKKAEALIEQAERLGFQVAYDSGFLIMTRAASAVPRRDDTAEIEHVFIKQMGKCRREVFNLAITRSRGVRGKHFVGQQVFVPGDQIVGTFANVTANGIVTLSYRPSHDQERVSNLTYTCPGDDLLIVVDDGRTDRSSPTSFSWIADEKVRQLFERAESVGLSLEHDSGFTLVKWRLVGGAEREVCEATIRQIGNSMRDVFAQTVAQARGRRGTAFVGQRVFVPEFDAFGILASSDVDGHLTVRYHDRHMESDVTCYCRGDGLLVILTGDETAARLVA